MFRVIIAGGRDFSNYPVLRDKCDIFFQNYLNYDIQKYNTNPSIEIVSGKAKGADSLGEVYAAYNRITVVGFPANWEKYGRGAGHRRNAEMGEYADALVAFWDGKSRGTAGMIGIMKKLNKPYRVVGY